MSIRFLSTLVCLLTINFLFAGNTLTLPSPTPTNLSSVSSCELPPPSDFHLVEQGPTSVTFAWTPIMDGVQHRIKIYRTSDGSLLKNVVVPLGQSKAYIDNLPLNTDMYAKINTICQNGDDGPPSENFPFKGFIMDIIVAGFTTGSESSCPIQSSGQSCYFYTDGSVTPFKVYRNNDARQFGVSAEMETLSYHTHIGTSGNEGQAIKLNCEGSSTVPCGPTSKIKIGFQLSNGVLVRVADFELIQTATTGVGKLRCISITQGWTIERMGPGPSGEFMPGKGKGGATQHLGNENLLFAAAAPNPFSETLDVYPDFPTAENIQIQLFNLSGQKVLDQQFAGGQEQYSLSTTGLANGFYLLRIEADGEVQTLKVVKSE